MHRYYVRLVLAAAAAILVCVGLTVAGVVVSPARATTSAVGGNPWTFSMNDPNADGLVVRGSTGMANPFIVFDRFNQPIAAVGETGGFKVFGDNIGVNAGTDIMHSQVTISPNGPSANVCVRPGQLWIGGSAGRIWRCAGGGHWNLIL